MAETAPRVVVLIDRYLPLIGGAQKSVHEICRALVRRGFAVTVLTRAVTPGLPVTERMDGVQVRRLGRLPFRRWSKLLCLVEMIAHLVRHRMHYDVVLAVPLTYLTDLLPAYLAGLLTGTPFAIRATMAGNFDALLSRRSALLTQTGLLPAWAWRRVLHAAELVIVPSPLIAASARGHGLARVEVIPNGVDTARFAVPTPARRLALRQRLELSLERLLVITTGRYVVGKNHLTLIKVAERIEAQRPGAVQVIVLGATEPGQITSSEAALKRYVRDRRLAHLVRFVDDVGPIEDYLQAADIFVFPSAFDEGMPSALLEAMACGLPIVSSDLPALRSFLPTDGVFFFSPHDDASAAGHLLTLIDSVGLRARAGAVVARAVRDRYPNTLITGRYGAALSGLRHAASGTEAPPEGGGDAVP